MTYLVNGNTSRYDLDVVTYCRDNIVYNPFTGLLFCKQTGKQLGWVHTKGHPEESRRKISRNYKRIRLTVLGRKIYAHNVIMMIHYGYCPMSVEHRDADGTNNKWDNLIVRKTDGTEFTVSDNQLTKRVVERDLPRSIYHRGKRLAVMVTSAPHTRKKVGVFDDLDTAIYERDRWYLRNRDLVTIPQDVLSSIEKTQHVRLAA